MAGEAAPYEEVVVDSSILILAERRSSTFTNLFVALTRDRISIVVPIPILAEVWRKGARQARLAQALKAMKLGECSEAIAKRAGELLAGTGGNNTMDAIVVATAEARACGVVTGDLKDLRALASHAQGVGVESP